MELGGDAGPQRGDPPRHRGRIGVCAPGSGEHDLTCSNGSDFAYTNGFGGTSGATPKVGAVAALMLNADPGLTHARIRKILHDTGRPVITEPDKPIGRFLDAEAAVRDVQSSR
ncbi:S8 family serine peptidase [Paractinoplanes toevensis]|uniref:Peptidase S8/S53 domain-containing protein n=1 Tax=Paractinoplanes toevensis TaxID=571911 RepID=A0A920BPN9_9ACTN|nr:S8 family serine peptidase [Actinoplanes toevensis]GIM95971.1 hypothetical protein Ato02nite_077640 [Actinoplanes toevensis]